jgi:hyperosmotically inducible periplasmic protein
MEGGHFFLPATPDFACSPGMSAAFGKGDSLHIVPASQCCYNIDSLLQTTSPFRATSDLQIVVCAVRVHNEEMDQMKSNYSPGLCAAILFGGALLTAGCQHKSFPDEKAAVTDSLKNNNLGKIDVWQDRDKGVMTLKGDVASDSDKSQAETLAKQAAPDYSIADEIGVRPPDAHDAGTVASKQDDAIEDNFEAAIKSNQNLDDQTIHFSAKNGTLMITGSVKTPTQKAEVSNLARHVPNVQQVVNELDVKPDKHSTPNS